MFTVSRKPVPETWLSSLPSIPVESKSLEPAKRIAMDYNRFSATSINSELLPELLSWSAIIDFTQRSAALPQPVPSDVTEEEEAVEAYEEEEEEEEASTINEYLSSVQVTLNEVFDPTTLSVGFDISCFDGLDDRLIYAPKDAFIDCCWSECVNAQPSEVVQPLEAEPCITPTPSSPITQQRSLFEWSSDESGSDTEESATPRASVDIDPVEVGNALHLSSPYPIAELPPYESLYWNHETKLNGLPCELQNLSDPSDSIGYFPIPANQQPKKLPRRLATLLQFGKRPVS